MYSVCVWVGGGGGIDSSPLQAYLLSLWSGFAKDDVDPEHLHDDRTKRKRYTEREEPQPSYAETSRHRHAASWNGKQETG